jgi:hypothetical protein
MLLAQLFATRELAMTFARRLKHVENIPQQDSTVNGLTKLTRTYAAQMATLKHYRTGGSSASSSSASTCARAGKRSLGSSIPKGGPGPRTKARTSPCKASYRCTRRRDAVRCRSGAGSNAGLRRCGVGGRAGCTAGLAPAPRPGRPTEIIGAGSGRRNGWSCAAKCPSCHGKAKAIIV